MPVYEYACTTCGEQFECSLKLIDPVLVRRPGCTNNKCKPEKKLSRFFGHSKSHTVPSLQMEKKESVLEPVVQEDSMHVCAKYCHLHNK